MKSIHWVKAAFAIVAVGWAIALPAAAWGLHRSAAGGLSPSPVMLVYAAGAVVCHQRPERSFHLQGAPLPVCARCTGIYAAAALTALALMLVTGRQTVSAHTARDGRAFREAAPREANGVRWAAAVAIGPTVLTLAWEWTLHSMPSNMVRAAAGVPIGAFVSWVMLWDGHVGVREDGRPRQSE